MTTAGEKHWCLFLELEGLVNAGGAGTQEYGELLCAMHHSWHGLPAADRAEFNTRWARTHRPPEEQS